MRYSMRPHNTQELRIAAKGSEMELPHGVYATQKKLTASECGGVISTIVYFNHIMIIKVISTTIMDAL